MYIVTIKAPNGKRCMDFDINGIINNNIDDWLYNNIIKKRNWIGELFYNDDPPIKRESSEGGLIIKDDENLWNKFNDIIVL
jgi:hypothetical protein